MCTTKALASLRVSADSPKPSLLAETISDKLSFTGPLFLCSNYREFVVENLLELFRQLLDLRLVYQIASLDSSYKSFLLFL